MQPRPESSHLEQVGRYFEENQSQKHQGRSCPGKRILSLV